MSTSNDLLAVYIFCRKTKVQPQMGILFMRITVRKQIIEFSLKKKIPVSSWNKSLQMCTSKSLEAKQINNYLQEAKAKIISIHAQLKANDIFITPVLLKNHFVGEGSNEKKLIELIDYHDKKMKSVLAKGTLKNYKTSKKYLLEFIQEEFKTSDIYLKQIKYKFLLDFEYFLNNKPNLTNNGIMKHMERLKKLLNFAESLEWIEKNPASRFKLKFTSVDTGYLTEEELELIETKTFTKPAHIINRDIFIFSCYTGLAYVDVYNLTSENLVSGIDGRKWISFRRQKTNTLVKIPLLHKAQAIIDKYKGHPKIKDTNRLLPVYSNQKTNQYIKEVAKIAKVSKEPSFHMARHTFATTVTLCNGVPIETVSKMLGHTKLATTQIYARVIDTKIADDFTILSNKYEKQNTDNKSPMKKVN